MNEIARSVFELFIIAEICGMIMLLFSLRRGSAFIRSLPASNESDELCGVILCRFVMTFFVAGAHIVNVILCMVGMARLNINSNQIYEVRRMFFVLCYGIPLIVIALDEIVLMRGSIGLLWKSGFLLHASATIITLYIATLMA